MVIPGARCPRLLSEIAELALNSKFKEVIVHVGTNYVYAGVPPDEIADEITTLIHTLTTLMPSTKVTFSGVLPRILGEGPEIRMTLNDISEINALVRNYCNIRAHCFIEHEEFRAFRGLIDRTLLARDGCHLSFHGVAAIEKSLRDHVKIFLRPY